MIPTRDTGLGCPQLLVGGVRSLPVALVTGGARGIGFAVALALVKNGYQTFICDLHGQAVDQAVADLAADAGQAAGMVADVTRRDQVKAVTDRVREWAGRLDVLINNAGVLSRTGFDAVSDEEWDRVMEVNLRGPLLCSQAAAPLMAAGGGGRIVNIASMAARTGGVTSGASYVASKTGLVGLTRHLARVMGPRSITANAICPGFIDTEMLADWTPEQRVQFVEQIPLRRLGTPEDVAGAVLFFASPWAAYVTGVTLDVNGGYYMA